jgi:hypothetical protein
LQKYQHGFVSNVVLRQKLKDIAFPQAEVLKKALLKRFEQEYAEFLVKKVTTPFQEQELNFHLKE